MKLNSIQQYVLVVTLFAVSKNQTNQILVSTHFRPQTIIGGNIFKNVMRKNSSATSPKGFSAYKREMGVLWNLGLKHVQTLLGSISNVLQIIVNQIRRNFCIASLRCIFGNMPICYQLK